MKMRAEGFLNMMNMVAVVAWLVSFNIVFCFAHIHGFGDQPLSKIAIDKAVVSLHSAASITATPSLLGTKVPTFSLNFANLARGLSRIQLFFTINTICIKFH